MRFFLLVVGILWLRTLRVRWPNGKSLPKKAVIVLWHEHLPACMRAFSHLGVDVLISKSADGAWAANACKKLGYRVHRGSSSRGSMGGLRALARALETGSGFAGMALDGPRGPRRIAKPGSLWLAAYAKAQIVPVFVDSRFFIRLKSWDQCLIPLPFSEIRIRLGKPINPGTLEETVASLNDLESGATGAPGQIMPYEIGLTRRRR